MKKMEIGGVLQKPTWKYLLVSIIVNGLLYTGTAFLMDQLFNSAEEEHSQYLFQGLVFGILFGIGFPFFMKWVGTKFLLQTADSISPDLLPDELVESEGPANLFRGLEGVGGRLFLTDKRVVFKSHDLNIQKGQTAIEYESINEVCKRKTAGLVSNGLQIKTRKGDSFSFVVNDRETWIGQLLEKVHQSRKEK